MGIADGLEGSISFLRLTFWPGFLVAHLSNRIHPVLMGNIIIQIYVNPNTPDTPWILRYQDPQSESGFNELRFQSVTIKTPCKTISRDLEATQGKYVLETIGTIYQHPTLPKATIQSNSLPRPY
jgi:hypothetical protein